MSMAELVTWFEGLPPGVEVLLPMGTPTRTGVVTNPARFVAAIREDLARRRRVPSLQGRLEDLKAALEGRAGPPRMPTRDWFKTGRGGER